jgi:hypothetical protein
MMTSEFRMALVLALTLVSVWVFFDAKSRGMWAWTWYLVSILFGFPLYLLRRYQLQLRSKRLGTPEFVPPTYKGDPDYTMDKILVIFVAVMMVGFMFFLTSLGRRRVQPQNRDYIQGGVQIERVR